MTTSIVVLVFILASFNTSIFLLVSSWPRLPPPFPGFPTSPSWSPYLDLLITNFYSCVNHTSNSNITFSDGFYDPNHNKSSFTSILNSKAENLRCLAPTIQKPLAIFTPSKDKHVQATVYCARIHVLNIRIRSGGHDYEGLSYISYTWWQPFIVLDLRNFNKVKIDIEKNTAWVGAGVTVGELYYRISEKSSTHAFPAGLCPDLGIGGHLTGGAYGSLMRKHGLGIDNVLDAKIIDARSRKLYKKSMGEDLFWAIRGGGGANFAVILWWKIRLVPVPKNVTFFSIPVVVEAPGGVKVLQQWQNVSHTISNDLFIRVIMLNLNPKTLLNNYQGLYLGSTNDLIGVMNASFPLLKLVADNCIEMSWIESVVRIAGFANQTTAPEDLVKGKPAFLNYFKAKSDFVGTPIPKEVLDGMFSIFREGREAALMIWTPYGGKMSEVTEGETAYPHRDKAFMMQYVANWDKDNLTLQLQNEAWIRKLYDYMEKYVSKHPRQSYVNYRDLDIGKNDTRKNCSYPSIWGPKYYKGNYPRLVQVKTKVDPLNVFGNEQSIPTAKLANGCTLFDVKVG